ncbi:Alcohol dehydrogenase superfamily zinc-type [Penicillium concentricum]|uniref:Alcohol dehydrogenase superfamily zinc-type n=1 Tax=Penicillium concentricum TaxID=293559 RepID=A0A9W9R9F7_9EURO|nr:Alcohol dehydrogenase superfamily zinc-type [Penicillium concentricum]KAJ5356147.1 Alcohol dehydrogenase superfamily zinc-type [Penicillium concentricum]
MVIGKAIVARDPVHPLTPNWSLEDVDVHSPGEGEILVEMRAVGICHTDLVLTSVPNGALGIEYPKVAGHEGAGIVRGVGKNVQSVEIGDPVLLSFYSCSSCQQCENSYPAYCKDFAQENYGGQKRMSVRDSGEELWARFFGQSSFAQYSVVSEASVINAKGLLEHDDELQLFSPLGCGFQTGMGVIQNTTNAGPGDTVLILGLGAVGMAALMTAKIRNCKTIIAVDRVKERLELAETLGATHTLDTSGPDFTTLDGAVKKLLPGGVSIVIETTGVPTLIEQGLQSTHARGRIVLIGVPPLGYRMSFDVTEQINMGRSIMGCIEGDSVPKIAIPQMIKWYREGRFPVDKMIKFFNATDYQQGLDGMRDGSVIKPVLLWKGQ